MKTTLNSRSLQTYAALVAVLVIVRLPFVFVPVQFITPEQAGAFAWPALIVIALLGLAGLWAASKTGFPELWDEKVTHRQRFVLPVGLGIVAGIIYLILVRLQPLGEINVPFPLSIPYYLYGGIVSEILFRLFIIPIPLWLVSGVLLKNRGQEATFWVLAVLTSLLEPLGQLGSLYQLGLLNNGLTPVMGIMILFGYLFNLIMAYLFRKSGFLAPLTFRLAFYILWHIL